MKVFEMILKNVVRLLLILLCISFFKLILTPKKDPYIKLDTASWVCTKTENAIIMIDVVLGKLVVKEPRPQTICTRYERYK